MRSAGMSIKALFRIVKSGLGKAEKKTAETHCANRSRRLDVRTGEALFSERSQTVGVA